MTLSAKAGQKAFSHMTRATVSQYVLLFFLEIIFKQEYVTVLFCEFVT